MNYTLTILRQRLSGKIHENDILEICHATQGTDGNAAKLTLYRLLFDNNKRIAENAAWIFTHFDLHNNEWLYDKQNELINETLHTASNTKRRLLLTLLLRQPFPPENLRTDFLDFCFSQMLSPQTAISIKSLCMKLTYEQCKHFPELRTELRTTLEMMEPDFLPAGVRSSRKNLLKILQKESN